MEETKQPIAAVETIAATAIPLTLPAAPSEMNVFVEPLQSPDAPTFVAPPPLIPESVAFAYPVQLAPSAKPTETKLAAPPDSPPKLEPATQTPRTEPPPSVPPPSQAETQPPEVVAMTDEPAHVVITKLPQPSAKAMEVETKQHSPPVPAASSSASPAIALPSNTRNQFKSNSPFFRLRENDAVRWREWNDAVFVEAQKVNKLIFLSVGFFSCHYSKLMGSESFETASDVTTLLNEKYIPVIVDRDLRPDIDTIYMLYTQCAYGGGGWPLSVFLTPTGKPILGGSYFPASDITAVGRPSFGTVLRRVNDVWSKKAAELIKSSDDAITQLRRQLDQPTAQFSHSFDLTALREVQTATFHALEKSHDAVGGGFGACPKFPRPCALRFLCEYAATSPAVEDAAKAKNLVVTTLQKMIGGGLMDVVLGGSFHRYSVTSDWSVPHFEKTLYDNAQMAEVLLDASQLTGEPEFKTAAGATLEWMLADLQSPNGAFWSALAADARDSNSKMTEGAYYVWSANEIKVVLGDDETAFSISYGVRPEGNVPAHVDPRHTFKGQNILRATRKDSKSAGLLSKLVLARQKREKPAVDTKLISAWNGMAIAALCRGYQVLGEKRFLAAAVRAAECVKSTLFQAATGLLLRSDVAETAGFAIDYSCVIGALISLYETGFDSRWLQFAVQLQEKQNELFGDATRGGYYNTTQFGDSRLLFRVKDDYDGAEISANSISCCNLLKLHQILKRETDKLAARNIFSLFKERLRSNPIVLPILVCALYAYGHPPQQFVFVNPNAESPDSRKALSELVATLHSRYIPNKTVMFSGGDNVVASQSSVVRDAVSKIERAAVVVVEPNGDLSVCDSKDALASVLTANSA